jgi:hypothetical protein
MPGAPPAVPLPPRLSRDAGGLSPASRPINPAGVTALLLGGAALLCAFVPSLCAFVIPAGALGLLTALPGLALSRVPGGPRPLSAAAGAVVGGTVLCAALVYPGLLGPTYRASRNRPAPTGVRVIPLPGQEGEVPRDPEWVDASRVALQLGTVRLQVTSASVGTAAGDNQAEPGQYLFLRLGVNRIDEAGQLAPAPPWDRSHMPTLTDNTGKVYAPRELPAGAEVALSSFALLLTVSGELFVFEAPPPDVLGLRLEVPAEAWGGAGALRFSIPADMIRRELFPARSPERPALPPGFGPPPDGQR